MKRVLAGLTSGAWLCGSYVMAAEATAAEKVTTFRDIIEMGGWPMQVIIGLSIFATFLVLFFIFTLRAGALTPRKFLREAEEAADEGDAEALEALCQGNDSAAAKAVLAAVEHVISDPRTEYTIVRDALEDEGARQASLLWQRIQYLMDVAVVAPMVGLLGTVLGMLDSFSGLESELGVVKPDALAAGVSKALVTTAGGLIVGISAMILYAIFRGRVNKLIAGLEASCNNVLRKFITSRAKNRY